MQGNNVVTLAFYKGWGGNWLAYLCDAITRAVTLSKYSHVEVIRGPAELDEEFVCWSSSFRDGGVRCKMIRLKSHKWDLIEVEYPANAAIDRIHRQGGKLYDLLGAILSPFPIDTKDVGADKWFCSEIAAHSLNISKPARWSPGRLAKLLSKKPHQLP